VAILFSKNCINFAQRGVAADGCDLTGAASGFGKPTTGRLAQAVKRVRQPGGVAPSPELNAEGIRAVRLAALRGQQRQVRGCGGANDGGEVGMDGDQPS
jgi:hypothetical protein